MGLDPYALGLTLAGAGLAVGGGAFGGPAAPLLIGSGVSIAGSGLTALGTHMHQNGATDEQIAAAEASARSAQSAHIDQMNRRAQQGVASQAAQGNTLGSGLYGRGVADVNANTSGQYAALNSNLEQNRLALLNGRTYTADINGLGLSGKAVSAVGSPLAQYGAASLARGAGGVATQAAAENAGGPAARAGGGGRVNFWDAGDAAAPSFGGAAAARPSPDDFGLYGAVKSGAGTSLPSWAPESAFAPAVDWSMQDPANAYNRENLSWLHQTRQY